jgi:hypothetical protein
MNKLDLNKYQHDSYVASGNGGSYLVKNFIDEIAEFDAGAAAKFQHNSIRVIPQSNLSNIFNGSAQQLDYQITRDSPICHFDKMNLRLTITNTGANVATLVASHFMIDYIEVLMGGGAIETIYAHHLFYNELYLANDDEEVFNNRNLRAFQGGIQGTAYTGPANLAVGASRTFYVEIPCIFTRTKAFIPAISQVIGIRVHFTPFATSSSSLATTIGLTDADLLIEGKEYNDVVRSKLLARYKSFDHVMPYYQPQRTFIPGQTISSTARTQVKVTEFGGYLSSQIVVFLLSSGANREALYNFSGTQKLDILRNGLPVSSYSDQPSDWILQQMSHLFGTTAVASQNIYVIPQSCYPVESADIGLQRGAVFMTNNDVLEIQASIANTYDVYVLCYRFCNVTITKDGRLVVQEITG